MGSYQRGSCRHRRQYTPRVRLAKWPDWLEDIHTNDLSIRDFAFREVTPYLAEDPLAEAADLLELIRARLTLPGGV